MRTKTILLVTLVLVSTFAAADTYSLILSPGNCGTGSSCDSFSFTTLVTPLSSNLYDLNFKVANTGKIVNNATVYDPAYLQGFGLTLFTGSVDTTSWTAEPTLLSGITVQIYDNSKFKNGNGTCGTGTHPGSICLDVSSANGIYIAGVKNAYQSFDFKLTLQNGALLTDSWHVMTSGTKLANGKGGNVFALSNDGPPTQTPEPGSMVLLGSGLLGVFGLARRQVRNH